MNLVSCRQSLPIRKYKAHAHSTWEIVCLVNGEVTTCVGEKVLTLSEGEIMLIPPNTVHKGSSDSTFIDMSLCVDVNFEKFAVIKDYRGDIASVMAIIIRLCTERALGYETVANSLTVAVCEMIRKELGFSSGFPAVEQIKKEIYENLSNSEYDLSAAISRTGFDKDYFRRRFKAETGKTPTQYITYIRIVRAKQLLRDEKMFSITAVANNCGFADNLYFSTCFKKHVGVSPLNYRKQSIGKV